MMLMLTKLLTLLSLVSYTTRFHSFHSKSTLKSFFLFFKVSRSSLVTVYNFQGEICVAFSRVYVQEGIYDEFEKKVVEKAKTWVVGDPFDPKIQQGSQTSKAQFEKILSYIELGKKEGATLLTGKKNLETRATTLSLQFSLMLKCIFNSSRNMKTDLLY
ncbi:hypothetical protein HN51_032206 [Arachis hypogaea]|nr:Aldehyde dehydrogenase family 2 member [Arachis hypogaea]